MRTASLSNPRDVPHWSRVCVNILLVLGVVAMLNMLGANSESMTPSTLMDDTAMTHSAVAVADHHAAEAGPSPDGGMTTADCCGVVMVCLMIIIAITAFVLAGRSAGGRVLWQLARPHSFNVGRIVAPFPSMSPLQFTAVLRV